jgi:AcrR family transcriptional regulator
LAVGTLYLYFKNKDELVVACAEEFAGHHRQEAEKILDSKASADEKLRRYILSRYRACKEVSTSSRHAAELAREVIRLHPSRLADDGQIMEQTIRTCLNEGIRGGLFSIADTAHDTRVFLFSIAYFFPNATHGITQWPAELALKMVMDWFIHTWTTAEKACVNRAEL